MRKINNRGFSLVELLVGMSMAVLLLAGLSGVLSSEMKLIQYNLSIGHVLAPGRNTVNTISDRLRYNAVSITIPGLSGSGNTLTYSDSSAVNYVISRDNNARSIVITKGGTLDATLAAGMVETLTFTRGTDLRDITIEVTFNDKTYAGSPGRTIKAAVIALNAK